MFLDYFYYNLDLFLNNFFLTSLLFCMIFFYLSSTLNDLLCLIGFFYVFVFYIMNINIYNLFYICTLACIILWALFLRINLFVFVFEIIRA